MLYAKYFHTYEYGDYIFYGSFITLLLSIPVLMKIDSVKRKKLKRYLEEQNEALEHRKVHWRAKGRYLHLCVDYPTNFNEYGMDLTEWRKL